jgi:hypothetical protein
LWSGGIGPGNRPAPVAIPQGWTLRHVLGATIAAPADYQAYELYDHGGGVVFQLTRGQTDGELLLLRWDIPGGTPEERADYWYRQDLQDPRLADRQVTLSQEEVNGQPSVVLTMTFRGDGGQLWRKRELYYNAGRQPWKIIVDAAVSDAQNTSGDELFEGALSTFRTDSG